MQIEDFSEDGSIDLYHTPAMSGTPMKVAPDRRLVELTADLDADLVPVSDDDSGRHDASGGEPSDELGPSVGTTRPTTEPR